jgi:hypothetical protein
LITRKWRLAAGATAASAVLAVGLFAAFSLTAKAGTVQAAGCQTSYTGTGAQTTALTCTATDTAADGKAIPYPTQITLEAITATSASDQAGLPVAFSWTSECTELSTVVIDASGDSTPAVADGESTLALTPNGGALKAIDPTTCNLTVTVTVTGDSALTATGLTLTVTDSESAAASASASASASPSPTTGTSSSPAPPPITYYNNQVRGFDGTCLDDRKNSSSVRAKVIIWQCNNTDQAQGWTYSGDELKTHGLCLNAKGNGKTGSRLILWNCVGSPNEIFSHNSHNEFVEKANGWSLCIDDPAFSTSNGTQLFVYRCNNGANQHWSEP